MHIKRLNMKCYYDSNMLIIVFFVAHYINPTRHMILIFDVCLLFVTHNLLYTAAHVIFKLSLLYLLK